jgi:parallel beta-helix repeat protein
MKKGIFCVLVCMLMIISMIIPVSGTTVSEKMSHPQTMGNTLYVGGSGPYNYTTIQDAVNDAVSGDTVFVFDDSSPYYENVIVDKSITVIGEDKESTVIDGSMNGDVVKVTVDNVDFSGFTVRNSQLHDYYAGIQISSSEVSIHDCNVYNTAFGVYMTSGAHNTIVNNHFEENYVGVAVTKRCSITGNILMNNEEGIRVNGRFNEIKENMFVENNVGLFIDIPLCFTPLSPKTLSFNQVINNLFQENKYVGVEVYYSNGNIIKGNNFISNGPDGYRHADFTCCYWQYWNGNYWSPRMHVPEGVSLPFPIKSLAYVELPKLNFDWHPAQEPYDIPGMS